MECGTGFSAYYTEQEIRASCAVLCLASWLALGRHAYVGNGNCDKLIKHSITFSCETKQQEMASQLVVHRRRRRSRKPVGCHNKTEEIVDEVGRRDIMCSLLLDLFIWGT